MTWMNKLVRRMSVTSQALTGTGSPTSTAGYVDFALGDTGRAGRSRGHGRRGDRRIAELGGITTMMPRRTAAVGGRADRRFGLTLVFQPDCHRCEPLGAADRPDGHRSAQGDGLLYCYHGSVDETFVITGPDGDTAPRAGNVGPAVPSRRPRALREFNDLASVEAGLAHERCCRDHGAGPDEHRHRAAEPGFLEGVRDLCTDTEPCC